MSKLARAASLLGLVLLAVPAQAAMLFNDGQSHVIDTDIADSLVIRNDGCPGLTGSCSSPGAATDVQIVSGGATFGSSDWITVRDGSSVELLAGGRLQYGELYDQSSITITGGFPIEGFVLHDQSTGFMSGGVATIGGALLRGDSEFTMTGGFLDAGLAVGDSARATVSGGSLGEGFSTSGDGILVIAGQDFTIDGVPVGMGAISATQGALNGTLLSGEFFSTSFGFFRNDNSQIILVPEPATASLLTLGVAGLAVRRRAARAS